MPRLAASPAEAGDLGEVLEFMRLLWAVEHGLQTTSKRMAVRIGLTGPQRLSLRLIGRFPGIAPGRLAALLRLHPSTITGVIGRLERRAFVMRRRDPADRRRARLFLSAAGRRLNRQTTGTVESAVRVALGRLGERQLAGARHVLAALSDQLLDRYDWPRSDATPVHRRGGTAGRAFGSGR